MQGHVDITGSKCRRHLDMPALSVCERCGDYICIRCLCDHDGHLYCPECLALQPAGAKPSARVAAHLIDTTVFVVPLLTVVSIAFAVGERLPAAQVFDTWLTKILLPVTLVMLAAIQLFLVHENGQSVGKRILGLRVVMLNGEPATLMRVLFLRNLLPLLLGFVPFIGVIFRIANAAALFSDGNRAIHDRFAGTKVVRVTSTRETTR